MKTTHAIHAILVASVLTAWLQMVPLARNAEAFDFKDVASVSSAYVTHLFFHEMGHEAAAQEAGAESSSMKFFTRQNGNFYPGLSTYQNMPEKSKLPYAMAGERMAGVTFDYALESYRKKPTTYNKALMFFSCANFFTYTLVANYVYPNAEMYDPNLLREETGFSKETMVSLAAAKSLVNAYRIWNPDASFAPVVWLDRSSAALLLRFPW